MAIERYLHGQFVSDWAAVRFGREFMNNKFRDGSAFAQDHDGCFLKKNVSVRLDPSKQCFISQLLKSLAVDVPL